jgi:antitoxin component YwqK of YwqJK toxin-antitoxin module
VNEQEPPPNFTGLWTRRRDYGARTEIEYVNGVPNGVWRYWHEHGACLREGFKKNGQWHGKLITRAADGTVLDVSEFDEGTGVYRIFNSNHQLTDEVPLRRGRPHGVARRWVLGKLVETRHYVDGQCVAASCEA